MNVTYSNGDEEQFEGTLKELAKELERDVLNRDDVEDVAIFPRTQNETFEQSYGKHQRRQQQRFNAKRRGK